jgi:hypothetical protein
MITVRVFCGSLKIKIKKMEVYVCALTDHMLPYF